MASATFLSYYFAKAKNNCSERLGDDWIPLDDWMSTFDLLQWGKMGKPLAGMGGFNQRGQREGFGGAGYTHPLLPWMLDPSDQGIENRWKLLIFK